MSAAIRPGNLGRHDRREEVSIMSTPTVTAPAARVLTGHYEEADRYEAVPQYTRKHVAALWLAAAGPMAVLAWAVAPWLSHHLGGREPLIEALLIVFNVGLVWILALTLIVVRREQGSLAWARARDALWLRAPRDPKTRRVGGRVWWWIVPFAVLGAGIEVLRFNPAGPASRDFPNFIDTDRADRFFQGAWGWFALAVLVMFLAPWVEELFFRGLLLPRMRKAFGKGDWLVNGAMFTLYHLHEPWVMPGTFLDATFTAAYPTKRFQSIWIGVVSHTIPSFFMVAAVLPLVLK
jgi:membrane protease YdiL (CAAX protease family)